MFEPLPLKAELFFEGSSNRRQMSPGIKFTDTKTAHKTLGGDTIIECRESGQKPYFYVGIGPRGFPLDLEFSSFRAAQRALREFSDDEYGRITATDYSTGDK